jgi:hypothetical protein
MTNVKEDKNAEIHARWLSVNGTLCDAGTYWLQDNNACCYTYANAYSLTYSLAYARTYHDADTSSCRRGDLWLRFCTVNVDCVRGSYSYLDQQRFSFPYGNQQ